MITKDNNSNKHIDEITKVLKIKISLLLIIMTIKKIINNKKYGNYNKAKNWLIN